MSNKYYLLTYLLTLMDPETDVKAASSSPAAIAAADAHISTRTDDDTIVVE